MLSNILHVYERYRLMLSAFLLYFLLYLLKKKRQLIPSETKPLQMAYNPTNLLARLLLNVLYIDCEYEG